MNENKLESYLMKGSALHLDFWTSLSKLEHVQRLTWTLLYGLQLPWTLRYGLQPTMTTPVCSNLQTPY